MSDKNEKETRLAKFPRGKNPNSLKNLKKFSSEYQPEENGRPLGSKDRSTIVKKWVEVEGDFKNPISKLAERMTVEDAMVLSMIGAVLTKQNVQAYNAIKDEIYGKLTEKNETELSGTIGIKTIADYNKEAEARLKATNEAVKKRSE